MNKKWLLGGAIIFLIGFLGSIFAVGMMFNDGLEFIKNNSSNPTFQVKEFDYVFDTLKLDLDMNEVNFYRSNDDKFRIKYSTEGDFNYIFDEEGSIFTIRQDGLYKQKIQANKFDLEDFKFRMSLKLIGGERYRHRVLEIYIPKSIDVEIKTMNSNIFIDDGDLIRENLKIEFLQNMTGYQPQIVFNPNNIPNKKIKNVSISSHNNLFVLNSEFTNIENLYMNAKLVDVNTDKNIKIDSVIDNVFIRGEEVNIQGNNYFAKNIKVDTDKLNISDAFINNSLILNMENVKDIEFIVLKKENSNTYGYYDEELYDSKIEEVSPQEVRVFKTRSSNFEYIINVNANNVVFRFDNEKQFLNLLEGF